MSKMEKSLTSEIKRRIEMNKSIQAWCEQQIVMMQEKFEVAIEERYVLVKQNRDEREGGLSPTSDLQELPPPSSGLYLKSQPTSHPLLPSLYLISSPPPTTISYRTTKIHDRLETLAERITDLNQRFEEEKERIPLDIERRGRELADMLHLFQGEFHVEKSQRLEREGRIERLVDDHEHVVAERFEVERSARESKYTDLQRTIETNEKSRIKADAKFHVVVETELQSLHGQIGIERKVREREDDEIVEALNRYTAKLQTSLTIINSTNT
jgi:hypothetical protein